MAQATSQRARHEAAETFRVLIAKIEAGELEAPAWFVERLRGMVVALEAS